MHNGGKLQTARNPKQKRKNGGSSSSRKKKNRLKLLMILLPFSKRVSETKLVRF